MSDRRPTDPQQLLGRRNALFLLAAAYPMGATMAKELKSSGSARLDSPTLRKLVRFRSPDSYDLLLGALNDSKLRGHLPAAAVDSLLGLENWEVEKLMVELLPVAQTYSQSPISQYRVGTVVRGNSGSLYLGTNIEIPGQVLGFAVHGEQCAVASAFMHDEGGLTALAVTAPPCGHCRQFLNELPQSGELKIIVKDEAPTTLGALLPHSFGPSNLGVTGRLLTGKAADLKMIAPTADMLSNAALNAAGKSYAPYTKALAGVAILSLSKVVYTGSYIESAAYNPSLSPLQAALVGLIMSGEKLSNVYSAVLVEMEKAPISQMSATQAVLDSIAPEARMRRIPARLNLQSH
jgi:cytidine deaminase